MVIRARMRARRPHQLSDELERFLHDQSTVGSAAWNRLFDETMAGLSFEVEGEREPVPLEAPPKLLTDRLLYTSPSPPGRTRSRMPPFA